ncbi:hypothetical protein [Phenylobacterium montanum]|uniref:Uncharacterized protein n=1 Tax=Phenylobacterium montanum TaxID=2823693 RepID=A0A975FWR8_9CAUL|nr:hypothetical protein [Caulobacter sp. S6]QUD86347.1 hypothetical protein KCG34_14700 [Caulobacter sp. S6]
MKPNRSLALALDNAYAAFASYPPPIELEAAPTRDPKAILASLSAAPLRHLAGEQIGPYAGWAMTTVGTVLDYKHFLPRILEQAVMNNVWMGTEPTIIAQRLEMASWRAWPQEEQEAVESVFQASWSWARQLNPEDGGDAASWFCGLAVLGLDVQAAISDWLTPPPPEPGLQLALLVQDASGLLSRLDEELGYWSYVSEATREIVINWLLSEPVRASIEASLEMVEDFDRLSVQSALKTLDDIVRRTTRH